jgi:hypothetical protein
MPGHDFTAQEALAQWTIFRVDPATAIATVSFRITQATQQPLGTTRCLVSGVTLRSTQATLPNDTVTNNYAGTTKIVSLSVQGSAGAGDPYWYPYLAANANGGTFNGVGEVTIPDNAPNGSIALTNAMNGCSLRVYRNNGNNDLKFFHDNNGAYLVHATMTGAGWTHLVSLNSENTGAKTRGLLAENIVYWDPNMGIASSVALLSIKVGGQWRIYRCVSDSGLPQRQTVTRFLQASYTAYTYNWTNNQGFNQLMHTI